ncbi:MAG: serine protease [Candidatus Berkiella sp.]
MKKSVIVHDFYEMAFPIAKRHRTTNRLHFLGSAILLNKEKGLFITCSHIFENIKEDQGKFDYFISEGISADNKSLKEIKIMRDLEIYDFAIVETNSKILKGIEIEPYTPLFGEHEQMFMGVDVIALGFTSANPNPPEDSIRLDLRFLKGHVTRIGLESRQLRTLTTTEISFALPKGMSGGPIVLSTPEDGTKPRIIGMSCANHSEQQTVSEIIEYEDEGKRVIERVVSLREYGIIHQLKDIKYFLHMMRYTPSLRELPDESALIAQST